MKQAVFRLTPKGTIAALLHVRSAGHYIVQSGWTEPALTKPFLELFWCVAGTGIFTFDDGQIPLNANEFCFYLPGDNHEFYAQSAFNYYWFTIDGPDLPLLIDRFHIRREPQPGSCPEELFWQLMCELKDFSPDGELRAGAIGYEILSHTLWRNHERGNPRIEAFKAEVEDNYPDPALSVDAIALKMQMHRSTLVRLVQRYCGVSPQEYLTNVRLQQAITLLKHTPLSVKEIARACGFEDQNYFCKAVKKRLGQTPSQIRTDQPYFSG